MSDKQQQDAEGWLIVDDPTIGRITAIETFCYYDGPLCFSGADATGQKYLFNAFDRRDGCDRFVTVALSDECLEAMRQGTVDMRNAILASRRAWWLVIPLRGNGNERLEPLSVEDIPEEGLPEAGCNLLDGPAPTQEQ